jgi:hypothetical protein
MDVRSAPLKEGKKIILITLNEIPKAYHQYSLSQMISKEQLLKIWEEKLEVCTMIKKRALQWQSHVVRRPEKTLTCQVLQAAPLLHIINKHMVI